MSAIARMKYVPLGRSGLQTSVVGFGCEQLGGFAWGAVRRDEVVEAIHKSIERGVNYFDTADVYALGESERELGQAIRGKRDQVLIGTKGGVRVANDKSVKYDASPEWLETALEASLKRLGTDYIDLYYLHYPDKFTSWEMIARFFEKQISLGKIRACGISNISSCDVGQEFVAGCASVQLEFSLANRGNESTIRKIDSLGQGPLSTFYGCLGQGMLSGKYDWETKFDSSDCRSSVRYRNFHGLHLERNLKIIDCLRGFSDESGIPIAQISLRWILDYLGTGQLLLGAKSWKQFEDAFNVLTWKLPVEWTAQLDSVSSLSEGMADWRAPAKDGLTQGGRNEV